MNLKWIKPNMNGVFVILCFIVAMFIILGLFLPVRYIFQNKLTEEVKSEPKIIFSFVWLIFFLIYIALVYPFSMYIGQYMTSKIKTSFSNILPFVLLSITVITIELACAHITYYTVGELYSRVYYIIVVGFNVLFIFVAFYRTNIAAILSFILALLIIPEQLSLGNHLIRVQAEAARIVTYAYDKKLKTGEFPTDFSDFKYEDSEIKNFIRIYVDNNSDEALYVSYWVGNKNASYWFSSKTGWGYRPD